MPRGSAVYVGWRVGHWLAPLCPLSDSHSRTPPYLLGDAAGRGGGGAQVGVGCPGRLWMATDGVLVCKWHRRGVPRRRAFSWDRPFCPVSVASFSELHCSVSLVPWLGIGLGRMRENSVYKRHSPSLLVLACLCFLPPLPPPPGPGATVPFTPRPLGTSAL